nr:PREDICTED: cyclin-L1-1-like [Musa acuminata subsp. malaccensis]
MHQLYNCGSPSFFSFVSSLTIKTTGQVLLHWFYCKKSFARFSVKLCVVSFEVGGMPKKSKASNDCLPQNGMNVEGENLPIELLDVFSKMHLIGTEIYRADERFGWD